MTKTLQTTRIAGYDLRWVFSQCQKWVHGKDLCHALGYPETALDYVHDRTRCASLLDIFELPERDLLVSREGVELLLNGC